MATLTNTRKELVHIRDSRSSANETMCGLNWAINMIGNVRARDVEAYRARPNVRICFNCEHNERTCEGIHHDANGGARDCKGHELGLSTFDFWFHAEDCDHPEHFAVRCAIFATMPPPNADDLPYE